MRLTMRNPLSGHRKEVTDGKDFDENAPRGDGRRRNDLSSLEDDQGRTAESLH